MLTRDRLAARFDNAHGPDAHRWVAPTTGDVDYSQLRAKVPALFAEAPHHARSDRYGFVPTVEVMRGLWREGWAPTFAIEGKARDASKDGFTKHMVRFRRRDAAPVQNTGIWRDGTTTTKDGVAELIMVNSHDGSTAYQLFGGWFRFVCANGCIVGDTFGEVRVPHRARIVEDVIDASFTIARDFPKIEGQVEEWRGIQLAREERLLLAEGAHRLRFGEGEEKTLTGEIIPPGALLTPRRSADLKDDLYTTYQVLQEAVIRGGVDGVRWNGEKRRQERRTARPVKGIGDNVRLNRELWALAEGMAKLKQAA